MERTMKLIKFFAFVFLLINFSSEKKLRKMKRLSALDLLGPNLSNLLGTSAATSRGGNNIAVVTKTGSALSENNSAATILGIGIVGTAKNSGTTATEVSGTANIKTGTSGDSSAALTQDGKGATASQTEGANVIDVSNGKAKSATQTNEDSGIDKGHNKVTEKSETTTLGSVIGDGIAAAATSTEGATFLGANSASAENILKTGGLLTMSEGRGSLTTASQGDLKAVLGSSSASSTSSGSGSVSITGNGEASTSASSRSSVTLS